MSILTADPAPRHARDSWDGGHIVDWMTKVPTRRLANASQTPIGETTLTEEEYRRRWVTGRFIEPVVLTDDVGEVVRFRPKTPDIFEVFSKVVYG